MSCGSLPRNIRLLPSNNTLRLIHFVSWRCSPHVHRSKDTAQQESSISSPSRIRSTVGLFLGSHRGFLSTDTQSHFTPIESFASEPSEPWFYPFISVCAVLMVILNVIGSVVAIALSQEKAATIPMACVSIVFVVLCSAFIFLALDIGRTLRKILDTLQRR